TFWWPIPVWEHAPLASAKSCSLTLTYRSLRWLSASKASKRLPEALSDCLSTSTLAWTGQGLAKNPSEPSPISPRRLPIEGYVSVDSTTTTDTIVQPTLKRALPRRTADTIACWESSIISSMPASRSRKSSLLARRRSPRRLSTNLSRVQSFCTESLPERSSTTISLACPSYRNNSTIDRQPWSSPRSSAGHST